MIFLKHNEKARSKEVAPVFMSQRAASRSITYQNMKIDFIKTLERSQKSKKSQIDIRILGLIVMVNVCSKKEVLKSILTVSNNQVNFFAKIKGDIT